jgi:hypothetical protein
VQDLFFIARPYTAREVADRLHIDLFLIFFANRIYMRNSLPKTPIKNVLMGRSITAKALRGAKPSSIIGFAPLRVLGVFAVNCKPHRPGWDLEKLTNLVYFNDQKVNL